MAALAGVSPVTALANGPNGEVRRRRAIDFAFWEFVAERPDLWLTLRGPGWSTKLEEIVDEVEDRTRAYDCSLWYSPPLQLSRQEIRAQIPTARQHLDTDQWESEQLCTAVAYFAGVSEDDASSLCPSMLTTSEVSCGDYRWSAGQ